MEEGKCPFCKTKGKIYGLHYKLPIGSYKENEYYRMDKVVLINCGECGAVIGAYVTEEKEK